MAEFKRPYLQHYVIEIYGLDEQSLASINSLRSYAYLFADQAQLHIVSEIAHDFKPGASLIFILSSSHIALHSWPEAKYLHIDLLLCEELPQGVVLSRLVSDVFKTQECIVLKINYNDLLGPPFGG